MSELNEKQMGLLILWKKQKFVLFPLSHRSITNPDLSNSQKICSRATKREGFGCSNEQGVVLLALAVR